MIEQEPFDFIGNKEKMHCEIRRGRRKKEMASLRKESLVRLFPLESETLVKFHQVPAGELILVKDLLIATIQNQRLETLAKEDYRELLQDIFYLVQHLNLDLHCVELLKDETQLTPQLIACFYRNFGPTTVNKWVIVMSLEERQLLYVSILDDEALTYIRRSVIGMVIQDMVCEQALEILEVCLEKGLHVKEILPACVNRLMGVLGVKQRLGFVHVNIAYLVCLRKRHEGYFLPLKNLILDCVDKLSSNSPAEKVQVERTLDKIRKLEPMLSDVTNN